MEDWTELNSSTGGRQTLGGSGLESTFISSSSSSVLLELELEMKKVGDGLDLSSEIGFVKIFEFGKEVIIF